MSSASDQPFPVRRVGLANQGRFDGTHAKGKAGSSDEQETVFPPHLADYLLEPALAQMAGGDMIPTV